MAFALIVNYPGRDIAQVHVQALARGPLNPILPGEFFAVESSEPLLLNGEVLTHWKERGKWIGALHVNEEINHLSLSHPPLIESSFFSHPTIQWPRSYYPVQARSQKKRVKIRLPANVQERVGDRHKKQKGEERKIIRALLRQRSKEPFAACLELPIKSKIVSQFGSPRTLPSGYQYFHTGVDFRAPIGRPIRASAPGRVIYAGHMILPGNHVMLDHGDGVISRYFHLSRIAVQEGDRVLAGQTIGQSGATGRVEGPHLHWELVWRGNRANPHSLLQLLESPCDRG